MFSVGQKFQVADGFPFEASAWAVSNDAQLVQHGNYFELHSRNDVFEREDLIKKIIELKTRLAETDYVVTKIAEGVATKEEYAEVLENRAKWRARINELDLIAYPDKPRVDLETAPL